MSRPLLLSRLAGLAVLLGGALVALACTAELKNEILACGPDACDCGLPSGPIVPGRDTITPPPNDTVAPDSTGPQSCPLCLTPGLTLRFTELTVTEPRQGDRTALPDFLNRIWRADVRANRLNIILQVKEFTENEDGSRDVIFIAGSAWHGLYDNGEFTPNDLQSVLVPAHLADNRPATTLPDAFYFVEGFTSELLIRVNADCSFESIGTGDLNFHPGLIGTALICSHGDPSIGLPRDTIPIKQLFARGQIDDTCANVTSAELRGCIAEEAACQICSFVLAPDYSTWSREESADPPPPGCDPPTPDCPQNCQANYCSQWCDPFGWSNFGGFVKSINLPLTCTATGQGDNDGYRIAGFWEATAVPYEEPGE